MTIKRILSVLCILLLLVMLSATAFAVEIPDPDRLGSISVSVAYRGEAVPGGSLTLYRVADVVSENGDYSYAYTEEFEDCLVSPDDPSATRLVNALVAIVVRDNLQGETRRINQNGEVTFDDLPIGLYLLIQHENAPGYSTLRPFLVSIPGGERGEYVYDVDATPKISPGLHPTPPCVPTPTPPSYPTPTPPPTDTPTATPEGTPTPPPTDTPTATPEVTPTPPPTDTPTATPEGTPTPPPTDTPTATPEGTPTPPPTEPDDDDDLPQTGQLNWPVPLLGIGGLFLVLLGLGIRFSGRKHSNEE